MPPHEWWLAGAVAVAGFFAAAHFPLTPYGARGVQIAGVVLALAILAATHLR